MTPPRKYPLLPIVITSILALLAAVLIAASFHYDQPVRDQIVSAQGKGWKKTADYRRIGAISKYGDWPQLMAIGGLGLLIAWKRHSREWQRILVAAMVASTLAGIAANASRLTTGRTRPRDSPKIEAGFYGPYHDGQILIGNSKYNAFPSGHTATAVGFAGVFVFARPLLGLILLLPAAAIAWSRMALGAHHLSDVVVSAVLALIVAWVVWRVAVRRGDAVARWVATKTPRRSTA